GDAVGTALIDPVENGASVVALAIGIGAQIGIGDVVAGDAIGDAGRGRSDLAGPSAGGEPGEESGEERKTRHDLAPMKSFNSHTPRIPGGSRIQICAHTLGVAKSERELVRARAVWQA